MAYVRKMEKKEISDYKKILAQFQIIPRQSIFENILQGIASIKINKKIADKYPFAKSC